MRVLSSFKKENKKLDKVKNILTFAVPTKRELLKRSLVTYKN
jgi:hypothetical protein